MSNMIPGVKMIFGGQDFEVPPLNIKLLRRHQAVLDEITDPERLKALGVNAYALKAFPVVLDALRRNYPELSPEDLEELLPVADVPAVMKALFKISGFERDGNAAPLASGASPSP